MKINTDESSNNNSNNEQRLSATHSDLPRILDDLDNDNSYKFKKFFHF